MNTKPVELIPVTVVVPVRNEEANLARCLQRLGEFAEVVVVDSGSTDRTRDIALEHGARYVNFEWTGGYPKKRNWFMLNHEIPTEWIFFLDADELVDEDFTKALRHALAGTDCAGFWLNYTNYFMGRRLDHGLPQRKLALFRKGRALFERIEEDSWSSLDMEVHEHPIVEGNVGEIKPRIDHRDDRGLRKFVEKHTEYAQWEAGRILLLRESADPSGRRHLTLRQKAKYALLGAWWYPALYFAYTYVVRLGFLDGRAGFTYASMKYWYLTLIQGFITEAADRESPST